MTPTMMNRQEDLNCERRTMEIKIASTSGKNEDAKVTTRTECASMTFSGPIAEKCRVAVMSVINEAMVEQKGLFHGLGRAGADKPAAPAAGQDETKGSEAT